MTCSQCFQKIAPSTSERNCKGKGHEAVREGEGRRARLCGLLLAVDLAFLGPLLFAAGLAVASFSQHGALSLRLS